MNVTPRHESGCLADLVALLEDSPLLPERAVCRGPFRGPLSVNTARCMFRDKLRCGGNGMTHLYTFLVLGPYSPALGFVLLRLLLGIPQTLRGGSRDGGLEVSLEPGVEARVVLALERCAGVGQAGGHDDAGLVDGR